MVQSFLHLHEYYICITQKKKEKNTSEFLTGFEVIPTGHALLCSLEMATVKTSTYRRVSTGPSWKERGIGVIMKR